LISGIPQTALVWAVLAGCWFNLPSNRNKKSAYYTVITLAALLLVINYFGSIRWLKNIDNDYYYAKSKKRSIPYHPIKTCCCSRMDG
jgi:hypothetical protein